MRKDSKMERRKFKRYVFTFEVLCKNMFRLFWIKQIYTGDVSRGGMKIYAKRNFSKGTILNLKVVNPFVKKPIRAKAQVMWSSRKVPDKDIWTMGLNFIDMKQTESDKLLYGVDI
jgi:c-di-GMP-binding flagellar brake protein YcgR